MAGTNIPYPFVLGPALYAVGIVLKMVSEAQRKAFKDDPANKGKLMRLGLWSWARHINYRVYALWGSAYCLVASGCVEGMISGVQALDSMTRAVPTLDNYRSDRYGEQWENFKKDVKWMI